MLEKIILLLHAAATLMMLGIIWFVQLAHYPLLKFVGKKDFIKYETEYVKRIMPYVIFVLLVELITGILLRLIKPIGVSFVQVWIGLILLLIIWLSTWLIQVPLHKKLRLGFDEKSHNLLVKSNWIRTISWTARAFLVIWMLVG